MLKKGALAGDLKKFIAKANKMTQEDAERAIDEYCNNTENAFYKAIKSLTITIPSAAIMVQGSPSAQSNVTPIVLNNVIS
jgi:hypothetical protein